MAVAVFAVFAVLFAVAAFKLRAIVTSSLLPPMKSNFFSSARALLADVTRFASPRSRSSEMENVASTCLFLSAESAASVERRFLDRVS